MKARATTMNFRSTAKYMPLTNKPILSDQNMSSCLLQNAQKPRYIPGYRLHQLKGDRKGIWSITVNRNWRITFEFDEGNAYIVNYEDYH